MAGRQCEAWAAPSEKLRLKRFSLNIAAMSFVVGEPPLQKKITEGKFSLNILMLYERAGHFASWNEPITHENAMKWCSKDIARKIVLNAD